MATNNSTNNWSPLTTKGDLFTYDTAPQRLPVGTDNAVVFANSSQSSGVFYDFPVLSIGNTLYVRNDFMNGVGNELNIGTLNTGTGSNVAVLNSTYTSGSSEGVVRSQTGTTTTGKASVYTMPTGQIYLANGQAIFETNIIVSQLSNGTDTYTINCGIFNASNFSVNQANSIWFGYTDSVNSGQWTGNCKGASSTSTVNSSTAPSTSVFQHLKIVVDSTAANVTFYINGTSIGTVSSNITAANAGNPALAIFKSAGTTSVSFDCDYISFRKDFSPTR